MAVTDISLLGEKKRSGMVYFHNEYCGLIEEFDLGYVFRYDDEWVAKSRSRISASLPLGIGMMFSENLFPFFSGLLSEGSLRLIQSAQGKIDENDDFGLLLLTCKSDAAGAVTVKSAVDVQ